MQNTDKLFKLFCLICASIVGLLVFSIFWQLCVDSADAWNKFGIGFIWSTEWDTNNEVFGALPNIVGTLLCTFIALVIAIPLAFVAALFVAEAPSWIAKPISQGIDLLAAIPSIIYGMWGLFVLVPIMNAHFIPFLGDTLGLTTFSIFGLEIGQWFFGTATTGMGFFTSGIILALMILPFMSAVMRDVFAMTPPMLKESAYGVGCTRWEATRDVMVRYGIRGILGGVFIGMGRALGETMAVCFVIGNVMGMPEGIFSSGTTIAATLASNFGEADGMQFSALVALGLILLLLSFTIQVGSQYYLHLTSAKRGEAR
ncbi:MAG: phosphate ABC transporter permease subunit PstC [Akkermansia sp.]